MNLINLFKELAFGFVGFSLYIVFYFVDFYSSIYFLPSASFGLTLALLAS